ncbi:somatomedin-B and thrombospondin type-1 domain-containing protein [Hemiscyllium ocellatum]|uniref:somatomedin-B and thrombospondin type-1 domain-containing protein n=1 Tax=Hemiscyllium ocellatum TaxID=170820 RepID=UPI0029666D49|nr:somatomedin-B and thrombospondin type-1 domain-containing protein [Hemiscyllium ocellatum]
MGNLVLGRAGLLLYWGTLTLTLRMHGVSAGCYHRENPKCCPGRNNECQEVSRRRTPCYCDAYCQKTGDCCEDYPTVCQISAIDCIVGPWAHWTECSSLCGFGSRDRARLVTIPPRNGGTPCPDLKQRRGCFGHNPDRCHSVKEVAKILPDTYKRNFKDPWKRPHMMAKEQQPSYCAYFQMKEVSPSCRLGLQTSQLFREKYVCVECQGEAMGVRDRCEGDGLEGTRTFWIAASNAGCQGSWVRESLHETCRCPPQSLIFV